MAALGLGGRGQTSCQSRRRTSGTVSGRRSAARSDPSSSPNHHLAQHGEIGVGQHGQRDVAVPAGPGVDLVLVETDLAFGRLEAGLDRPARAADPDQVGERRAVRGMGEVEGELVGLGDAAPDQEALLPAGRRIAAVGQIGPVVEPGTPRGRGRPRPGGDG
jgi:hypothetical protein